jgi:hypothetical protein
MDGAFALYEAVNVLRHAPENGQSLDTALVYAFARPSRGELDRTLALQLDPYYVAPLWPDARSLAGLQAQALRDSGIDVAEVPPTYVADGALAIVLAVGDTARSLTKTPAWIRGIDHRIEPPSLGVRDLTASPSTQAAAKTAGAMDVDTAFLHTPYPHQELVLRSALGLGGQPVDASAGPMMVGGLERFAAAAAALAGGRVGNGKLGNGKAQRAVVHATAGPCLQQNLVALLEGAAA